MSRRANKSVQNHVGIAIEKKINETLARAKKQAIGSQEQSDYAKYLCILVSGYLEKSITSKLMQYCDSKSNNRVSRFAESKLKHMTNMKYEKILELLKSFDSSWGDIFEKKVDDKKRDQVNGLVGLRNAISHGGNNSITINNIEDMFDTIKNVVNDFYESTNS